MRKQKNVVHIGYYTGELIASGKMDAGTDLAAAILPSMENGLKITYVLGFHTGCTKFYVRQDSGINSVEDLKGKKVAIPGLQDTAYMNLRRKLESVGIKTSQEDGEVEFIVYDQTSIPIALDKGNVDVIGIHDSVARISDVPELQDALKATNNDFVAATNLLKQHIRERQAAGDLAAVVASVGTAGTIRGISDFIHEQSDKVKIFAVEPAEDDKVLTGIHNFTDVPIERVPPSLKSENAIQKGIYDEVFVADPRGAFEAARTVAKTDGVLVGNSSGAALWGATKIAQREEFAGKNIVVVFPDTGLRYLSTELFES